MRAYIITTADSKRVGRSADLTNYPSSLPDPELFYGVTPATEMQRRHCAYAPLGFIAYQQDGYSLLWQKRLEWGEQIHRFYYIGMDGKLYYY